MKKASELAGKIIEQAMDSNVVELSKKEQVEN
jgi:hypothetical protein